LLAAYQEKFRFVMVDEYQDTNAAQFTPDPIADREHRNLCVVGDDESSIYGWRGAQIANLLDMEKHFPDVKVIKLEQNYRSTNVILNAANHVINTTFAAVERSSGHNKAKERKSLCTRFRMTRKKPVDIVEQIEFARLAHRIPWAAHAILFRTNQQSRSLETALRKASVRYHLIGGQSYFDRREVKDFSLI